MMMLQVLLDMVDSSTVFVHSFSARLWDLTDRALRHRANRLMTTLRNHGEAFHDRYYYLAAFSKSLLNSFFFKSRMMDRSINLSV